MPDRLAELRRQRTLIADHLAWLDREIAAIAPVAPTPAPAQTPPTPEPVSLRPTDTPLSVPSEDAKRQVMLGGKLVALRPEHPALPDHNPVHIKSDVRRGCFLYVALAALLVVLGGALLVWASQTYKAKHPPASRQTPVEEP